MEGLDYSWGRPGVDAIKASGREFVVRYLSYDATGKNLTVAEAAQLSAAGIWIALVFQHTARRMLQGQPAGITDAVEALKQMGVLGVPGGRPVYFACDFDAQPEHQPALHAYLDGAASVLGRDRTGMYGGYGPLSRALDARKAAWGWQTAAWSGGKWDARAQLQQYSIEQILNGASVDYVRSTAEDFGQWRIGVTPGMAITDADAQKIARAVLNLDGVIKAPDGNTDNPYWALKSCIQDIAAGVRGLRAAGSTPADIAAIMRSVLAESPAAAPDEITARVVAALPPVPVDAIAEAVAQRVLDGLHQRLSS